MEYRKFGKVLGLSLLGCALSWSPNSQAQNGKYALDGTTGKELWNSGTTITSFARGGVLSGGVGQIYLTTHDGVIYAFGFPMEH